MTGEGRINSNPLSLVSSFFGFRFEVKEVLVGNLSLSLKIINDTVPVQPRTNKVFPVVSSLVLVEEFPVRVDKTL